MSKYLWYIIAGLVFAAGVVLAIISAGKVKLPAVDLKTKFRAIDAEAKAKKLEKELGKEKALAVIEEEFKETISKLDEEEQKEHKRLKDDPKKLARLLAGKN